MTEQAAIRILENLEKYISVKEDGSYQLTIAGYTACDTAISALKEIQQYKSIGTVAECRKAVKRRCKECSFFKDEAIGKRGGLSGVCEIQNPLRRYGTYPACKSFKAKPNN